MLLTGIYHRSLDEKRRVAIPKKLRDALDATNKQGLYIAPGTDGSLAVYAAKALENLAERLAAASPTHADVRAFSRLFYAQCEQVEVDRQGRMRIPQRLAELAGLGKEAVLIGVQDHVELWDQRRWETYFAQRSPQYDELAEKAFGTLR